MVDLTGFEEVYRTKNYGVYENPDTFENVLMFLSRVNPAKHQEIARWKAPGTRNDGVVIVPVAFLGELKGSQGEAATTPRRRPVLNDEQLAAAIRRAAQPQWEATATPDQLRGLTADEVRRVTTNLRTTVGYRPVIFGTINTTTGDVTHTTADPQQVPTHADQTDDPGF